MPSSFLPTSTPSVTPSSSSSADSECKNYPNWVDSYEYGCDFYEQEDYPGCPYYGNSFPNDDGITANEACCHCQLPAPSPFPTTSFKPTISINPTTIERSVLCKDTDGLDCYNHLPNQHQEFENFFNYTTEKELATYLNEHCCVADGGEHLSVDNPLVAELINQNATSIKELFSKETSAEKSALFWLAYRDSFDISPKSKYLTQRFALVLFYYQLGGPTLWKKCWNGKRYSGHENFIPTENGYENFYDSVFRYDTIYSEDNCNEELGGGVAWLTGVHECEWAFVQCDRSMFVTGIQMSEYISQTSIFT